MEAITIACNCCTQTFESREAAGHHCARTNHHVRVIPGRRFQEPEAVGRSARRREMQEKSGTSGGSRRRR